MCIVSFVVCPVCGEKIDGLEMIRTQGSGLNDWIVSREYHCPHCQEKFICTKITIGRTAWDEKAKKYKCSCAVPEFGEIIKGEIKMNNVKNHEGTDRKEVRIDKLMSSVRETEELCCKVLAMVRTKKETYFGEIPEKVEDRSGVPVPSNGIIDAMNKSTNTIQCYLNEIAEIISLF